MDLWSGYLWIPAFGILVLVALWRSRQARRALRAGAGRASAAGPAPGAAPTSPAGAELVAVIAAAVAAASGLDPSRFRIAEISASGRPGAFNTPPWGHADRLGRLYSSR